MGAPPAAPPPDRPPEDEGNGPPAGEQPQQPPPKQTGRDAVPEKERTETLRVFLEKNQGKIVEAAANRIKPDRLLKLALTVATRTPLLVHPKMDKLTVLRAVLDTASLGLDLSPGLGEAYLVPYWSDSKKVYECQLIIGYRGLVTLARRSDAIKAVDSRPVFHGEQFEPHYGTDPKIIHIPKFDAPRTAEKLVAVYTVWHLTDGGFQFDVMSRAEIDDVRKRSKAKDNGPWVTDYIEMGKKSITRRSSKLVPMTVEAAEAIEADARREFGDLEVETVVDKAPVERRPGAGERLAVAINSARAPKELTEGAATEIVQDRGSLADMELVEVEPTSVEELREQVRAVEERPAEPERSRDEQREDARELYRRLMTKKFAGGERLTKDELAQLTHVRTNFPEILVDEGGDDTEHAE